MVERLTAADLHRAVAGSWPAILASLGVDEAHLRNRHGPCPACGGRDRFRFDDKDGRGTFYCSHCGSGDGFKLLQVVHGWGFSEAFRAVADSAGFERDAPLPTQTPRNAAPAASAPIAPAKMSARVRELLRTSTTPDLVPDAVAYLQSRSVWPVPAGCTLRAHAGIDYYRPAQGKAVEHVDRFPALVAKVEDIEGAPVTAHVTYLQAGAKAAVEAPRKLLSGVTGWRGCAVRLLPLAGDVLGIAEGLETAIAASVLHDGLPVWAALNTTLLAKFVPPPEIRRVIVFADADVAGLRAAWELRDELEGRCEVELRAPREGDWADVLVGRVRR